MSPIETEFLLRARSENSLRAYQRLLGVFARRRIYVREVAMFADECGGGARFSALFSAGPEAAQRLLQQVLKIVEIGEARMESVQRAAPQ